ncbi:hypothetical protein [Actinacidiphila paucisporea]|uniref:Uncharacterized protein n=1 Tax=Actinacidiphila paucisporea TaxID=310782 RepID=A0A1M7ACY3_9ACTN|nr:hypothetical protein [Actinacidiphila paucisporea]SHL40631.1 hypothetical protein SAMN05216499_10461 [Actinacidiphila paucisporea]
MADIDLDTFAGRYIAVWNSASAATSSGCTTWSGSVGVWAPLSGAEPQGGGLQVLLLGPDGRIATDYQFIGL